MSENLKEIWQDPAEAIGEMLLTRQVEKVAPALAQLPLLSIVMAAYKSHGAISDYLLTRKVQQFYTAWEGLSREERQKVMGKFKRRPRAFAEKLLFILDQQEDLEKCRLLGILTTAYLRGHLKRAEYLDLIESLTQLSLGDIRRLYTLFESGLIVSGDELGERYAVLFITRGLVESERPLPEEQRGDEAQTFYRITPLGLSFIQQVHDSEIGESP